MEVKILELSSQEEEGAPETLPTESPCFYSLLLDTR